MKKVVVFGAGLVAGPLVKYLLDRGINVTVASRTLQKAERLVEGSINGTAEEFNIKRHDPSRLISDADLVISLLPYVYHTQLAEMCIKAKKHLVTTSYVSRKMQELDAKAKEAGVIILNEVGLDPGIDHMSAMEIIERTKAKDGKIRSFYSYCGGLPAPEANTNPWGYKFSWSPKGVVLAGKNNARYLKNGKEIRVPSSELFRHYWTLNIDGLGKFEAYPNRDSIPYIRKYGLEGIKTMYRGTLRNIGWCDTWYCIGRLGLLDDRVIDLGNITYGRFVTSLIRHEDTGALKKGIAEFLNIDEDADVISRFEWLSLFGDDVIPPEDKTAIDILAGKLNEKLQYGKGERDMIVLRHEFEMEYGSRVEKIVSTLIDYGIPGGFSSMSRTVGLPAAISTKLILDGEIGLRGVQIPVHKNIYKPVLEELERVGIGFKEKQIQV